MGVSTLKDIIEKEGGEMKPQLFVDGRRLEDRHLLLASFAGIMSQQNLPKQTSSKTSAGNKSNQPHLPYISLCPNFLSLHHLSHYAHSAGWTYVPRFEDEPAVQRFGGVRQP